MQKERDLFLSACVARGFGAEPIAAGKLAVALVPRLRLALAIGGTGKAQFAAQTQHLLDYGSWTLALCAGAAGALADELNVGDVVVATATVEHDFNNKFSARPLPRFDGASSALAELRGVAVPDASFRVHFGMVASGDEDIVDAERRRAVREATGALAVAWEGAGGARACKFSDAPFLEIRGITDAADHTAPKDFESNLHTAMGNLAHVVINWMSGRIA